MWRAWIGTLLRKTRKPSRPSSSTLSFSATLPAKLQHAHIPWRAMKGMRNRIAHGYFEINLDVVWETVQTALPALKVQLAALAPSQG